MDKIIKLLNKLSASERTHIEQAIARLFSGSTQGLDIKKLKGRSDTYRIRVGSLRIIFLRRDADIRILEIARRNENTY